MSSPATIIGGLLIAYYPDCKFQNPDIVVSINGGGSSSSALPLSLFVASMPDQPDESLCAYDTEGVLRRRLLASGQWVQDYGVQLKLRQWGYDAGYNRLKGITTWFAKVRRQPIVINGITYTVDSTLQTSSVLAIGQDEKRRQMFTLNLLVGLI